MKRAPGMKAIILAGGYGSRLLPLTENKNKTMVEINGKPIIDYILNSISKTGITDLTIVANQFIDDIRNHVGDKARFVREDSPKGVSNAIQLSRCGNENSPILLWFADNLTNINLKNEVENFNRGALFLTREVEKPSDFGIVTIKEGTIVDIEEKPSNPQSNIAIGGIYIFDETFWGKFDSVSQNSDFSISQVTRQYVIEKNAKFVSIGENSWLDCGTPENLQIAERLVSQGIF